MPRHRKRDIRVCPNCGYLVEKPIKTWSLVSPLPDKKGRVTITIMASFQCPRCGHRWRGVLSKVKAGGGSVELETGSEKKVVEEEEERSEIIELSLEDILEEE